jgi:hypothetical protein
MELYLAAGEKLGAAIPFTQRNNFDEDNRPPELVDAITIIPIINLIMFPMGRNTKSFGNATLLWIFLGALVAYTYTINFCCGPFQIVRCELQLADGDQTGLFNIWLALYQYRRLEWLGG